MRLPPGEDWVPPDREMRQFVARKKPFIPEPDHALGQ